MAHANMKSQGTSGKSNWSDGSHRGWGQTSSSSRSRTGPKTGSYTTSKTVGVAPGYRQVNNTFACKVESFKTLWEQTKGAVSKTRPTPATLKSFTNWINKGANVYRVTNTQIKKWCNPTHNYKTNASVKNALCTKFGKSTIKAVCSAKSGGYIVATSPTWKGKSFRFPS
ncbi:MAG: hypothetical protein IID40_03335 [Planctomycetes bacterium]|nr:hypothetical protein [Planctomycetota bacterium]